MNVFRKIGIRLRSLFRRGERQAELDEEMQFHLELRVEELTAQGIDPTAARRQAWREFGHVDSAKEATRDTWGVGLWHGLARDLNYSLRSLRRSPVFSLAVILTIALCIAANICS